MLGRPYFGKVMMMVSWYLLIRMGSGLELESTENWRQISFTLSPGRLPVNM